MASLWRSRAIRPYLSAEPVLGGVVGSEFWPPEVASPDIAVRQTYKTVNSRVQRGVTVMAGDSILVGFYQDGALISCSISDDAAGGSNTYEEIGEGIYVTGGSGCGIRTFKATAKATETLTITETGGSGYPIIFVHVVEGPTEVGGVVTKADTVASLAHTSGELTVPEQDAYLLCFWGEAGGAYTMAENGAGFRKREDDHGTATHDRIVSAPGTYQDVVLSSGNVLFASMLLSLVLASSGVNGTGSSIQAQQSGGGTGTVTLAGTGASSQRVQSCTGTGTQSGTGTGASTQRTQTGTGTGTATQTGTGASSQRAQSGGGSGSVTLTGSGGSIQRLQTCAGTGTNITGATGSGGSVQALQSGSGVGTVTLSGSGASAQRVQASSGTGSMALTGTGAVFQAIQGGSGAGTLELSGAGASIQALQAGGGTGGNVPPLVGLAVDPEFMMGLPPISTTFYLAPVYSDVVLVVLNTTVTLPPVDPFIALPALKNEVIA